MNAAANPANGAHPTEAYSAAEGGETPEASPPHPFDDHLEPRTTRHLRRRAAQEATRVRADDYIGVEHIFLAILADQHALPTQVMAKLGVVGDARRELETVLKSEGHQTPSTDIWQQPPPSVD